MQARAELLVCAQASCPRQIGEDCTAWLVELEASLPSVVFAAEDGAGRDVLNLRISEGDKLLSERADGRALEIDPGPHRLRFEADGYAPQELEVSIREAEKRRMIRVVLAPLAKPSGAPLVLQPRMDDSTSPPPAQPRARRLLLSSYVLAGVSVATLATGLGFGLAGKNKRDQLDDCAQARTCSARAVDVGRRHYVIADVAFGAGAAFAVGSALTFFLARRERNNDSHTLSCAGHLRAVHCALRTRF